MYFSFYQYLCENPISHHKRYFPAHVPSTEMLQKSTIDWTRSPGFHADNRTWGFQDSKHVFVSRCTWSDNKVRELIAVKRLHTSLLNTTVVAFKVLPLGSYAPMPAPSLPFKTILELVLWNGFQSFRCINPDVINVIKMLSFQFLLYLQEQKKVTGG